MIAVQLDMQNRWLFVLTDQNSIYLWNYFNQNLVIKIPLCRIIEEGQFIDFKIQYLTINGDIKLFLHTVQQNGNLLISLILKDKSEVQWKGLKVLKPDCLFEHRLSSFRVLRFCELVWPVVIALHVQ